MHSENGLSPMGSWCCSKGMDMEFNDKIMLRCFPKMKCQQGMIFSTQLSRFLQAVSFIKYGVSMYHIYIYNIYIYIYMCVCVCVCVIVLSLIRRIINHSMKA